MYKRMSGTDTDEVNSLSESSFPDYIFNGIL